MFPITLTIKAPILAFSDLVSNPLIINTHLPHPFRYALLVKKSFAVIWVKYSTHYYAISL